MILKAAFGFPFKCDLQLRYGCMTKHLSCAAYYFAIHLVHFVGRATNAMAWIADK